MKQCPWIARSTEGALNVCKREGVSEMTFNFFSLINSFTKERHKL